ncbi:hypothetical protein CspeluHIS016_0503080 [Cutaneotrichosporon spelunceum]|uniref:Uncharacterized protein n=1 Tax=Cutaneotrichosporon spelunceum TaxID=1672016 RepID=A0AAD3TXB8_9TREE|nr:hypothetical protein CspeluHIS016_0503080 [Cutaneotrichosporon spelunceum]
MDDGSSCSKVRVQSWFGHLHSTFKQLLYERQQRKRELLFKEWRSAWETLLQTLEHNHLPSASLRINYRRWKNATDRVCASPKFIHTRFLATLLADYDLLLLLEEKAKERYSERLTAQNTCLEKHQATIDIGANLIRSLASAWEEMEEAVREFKSDMRSGRPRIASNRHPWAYGNVVIWSVNGTLSKDMILLSQDCSPAVSVSRLETDMKERKSKIADSNKHLAKTMAKIKGKMKVEMALERQRSAAISRGIEAMEGWQNELASKSFAII